MYKPTLTYSNVFDDYDTINIKDLLKDISTLKALKLISDIAARLYMNEGSITVQKLYYDIFITLLPQDDKIKLDKYLSENKVLIMIVNNMYNIAIIDYLVTNSNNIISHNNLDPSSQLNLFKAYLYLGQKNLNTVDFKVPNITINDEEVNKLILPNSLPFVELQLRKNFLSQTFKAKLFFQLCNSDSQFKVYIDSFLEYRHTDSWENYLASIIRLYLQLFNIEAGKTAFSIRIIENKDTKVVRRLLNTFVLNISKAEYKSDYLNIRNYPIVKLAEDDYMVLNMNFLIDKLFQAIQFDFALILSTLKLQYKGKPIEGYIDFKNRFYAPEFSEKILFYSVMEYFTERQKLSFKSTGKKLKTYLKDGEPDYFYRDKGKVFFFEFKDTFFSAESKYSRNYSKIYDEILKKFVVNNTKSKGVNQLANVITYYVNNNYMFDNYLGSKMIFPILVVPDDVFNASGFNFILKGEFNKILKSLNIDKKKKHIKDLTLITLDFFIEFQELFNDGNLRLHKLILDYHQFVSTNKYVTTRLISFAEFFATKVNTINHIPVERNVDQIISFMESIIKNE